MRNRLISIFTITATSLLAVSIASAKPPFHTPPKGGLPQCKADLAACNSDLGEAQVNLVACQNNLATCEDTLAAIEPEILVIDDAMPRRPPGSTAEIEVEGAVPDTLFTVWLRIRGGSNWNTDVNGSLGSPLTGGGSTPLAPGSALDDLNAISPWVDPAGASSSINSFTTDADGDAAFKVDLDFPIVGGAYPFHATTTSRPGFESVPNVGYAIPTPDISPGTPYLVRVVSQCSDQVSHGLSPAVREAWFQYP